MHDVNIKDVYSSAIFTVFEVQVCRNLDKDGKVRLFTGVSLWSYNVRRMW